MDVAAIGAPVAPVATKATTILPDVVRLLTRGRRIALAYILAPLADVLMDVATVSPYVTAVAAEIAPVAAKLVTVSRGISGLLGTRRGGHANGERQQRGDDGAVSHDLYFREVWMGPLIVYFCVSKPALHAYRDTAP